MKKSLFCLMASLLLCGAVSAQHFTSPDAHAKSGNTPIVAAVTVDNAAPATGAELAVYVGNELRGLATTTLDGKYWVQAFYNSGSTETLTFKLWNPADGGAELDTYTLTYTYTDSNNQTVTLDALTTCEEGYGTPSNPVQIAFTATQTQSTAMVNGWNWWSASVELNQNNGLEQLEQSLGENGVIIKSRLNGDAEPLDLGGTVLWVGELSAIYNEQMYMIQTNAASTVRLTGQRPSFTDHPITINEGWNWIGFPSGSAISLADAFAGFTPEPDDQIKGRNGTSDYLPGIDIWAGSLEVLTPGQGYMYYSHSSTPKTLVYQAGSRVDTPEDNMLSESNLFTPAVRDYAYNMSIVAVVDLDGDELRGQGYELAAFVGNECRGSAKLQYVEPLDRYVAFLLVFGDAAESLNFVLSDGVNSNWSNDHITYYSNAMVGTIIEPKKLHFGTSGLDENGDVVVTIYPNPSKDVFNVFANSIKKIDVFNVYGQAVYSTEVKGDNYEINLSGYAIGTYLLRVTTENGIVTKQLIKE